MRKFNLYSVREYINGKMDTTTIYHLDFNYQSLRFIFIGSENEAAIKAHFLKIVF